MRSRSRYYSFVLYCSTSLLDKYILHSKEINHSAYIVHNMEDCESHIHFLAYYYFPRDLSACVASIKSFLEKNGDCSNVLGEPLHSRIGAFNYLTHKNKPDKFQYDDSFIVTSSRDFWEDIDGTADNTLNILDDINSDISFRTLVRRYGRDFVIHLSQYELAASRLKDSDRRAKLDSISGHPPFPPEQLKIPEKK